MKKMNIKNVGFERMKQLDCKGATESTLYTDGDLLYKEYNSIFSVQHKKRKLELLSDGGSIPNIVIPNAMLMDGLFLSGCTMKYIPDAISLKECSNSDNFIMLLYLASLSLKKIHEDPRNIVVGDLHFDNIIIDKNLEHYFIDMDSCMVKGLQADRLPKALMHYVINRGNFRFDVGRDTDKFCMFLATMGALFSKNIESLTMYEFDEKAEKLCTLKNMREFVLQIKNSCNGIPNVPYLSELISVNEFSSVKKLKVKSIYAC